MRIAFHTFGCRLNRAETLDSEALAIAEGHEIVEPGPDAEIIEVRACSVTARAQRDCEKFIEKLKKDCPQAEIRVTGCIPGAIRDKKKRSKRHRFHAYRPRLSESPGRLQRTLRVLHRSAIPRSARFRAACGHYQ
jgi:tRNA A37 methylthiotransferase MiaB